MRPKDILLIALSFGIANLFFTDLFFKLNHYLPAPFLMDKSDTFMDFYNPLYWVINGGFYTTFNSVYPALNYFILKIYSFGAIQNTAANPHELRMLNPGLTLLVTITYFAMIFAAMNMGEWRKIRVKSRFLIFIAVISSLPFLFALERGNLIFFAVFFLALYLSARGDISKALYLALLINIKPYFLILLIQYFNKKRFNGGFIVLCLLFTFLVFLLFGFLADLNFLEFLKAYLSFSKKGVISAESSLSFPSTISALNNFKSFIGVKEFFGYQSSFRFWFSSLMALNYIAVLLLVLLCILGNLSKEDLLISSFVLLTNFSQSTGGYVLLIYILLIPYLLHDSQYVKILLPILLIFSIPWDWIPIALRNFSVMYSYLGEISQKNINLYLGFGSLIRPCLNFSIMLYMIIYTYKKLSPAKN
ncbi:hypothetical protein G6703_01600 [Polynucleobacter paneuropaeus]|nr:hypothetical protein G6703_01600 [Polynucleobacter paneuropaeus]